MNEELKPGSEVWVVFRDIWDVPESVHGFMLLAQANNAVILSPMDTEHRDLDEMLDFHIQETSYKYSTDLAVFPANDCYYTLEEATAAMNNESELYSD